MHLPIRLSQVTPILFLSVVALGHDRSSLDHKVRMSDFILIGTVTATEDVDRKAGSFDPAETASKVATIRVEEVLKGNLEEAAVRVGFRTSYVGEDNASIRSVAFSHDGTRIVGGGGERLLKVWDATTGKEQLILSGHAETISTVAFSTDDKLIASGGRGWFVPGEIKVWDAGTGKPLHAFETANDVNDLAFSPDSQRLAWTDDRSMTVLNLATGEQSKLYEGSRWSVSRLAFSPNGDTIAVGTGKVIRLLNARTGDEILSVRYGGSVYALMFSSDGKWLVAGGSHGTLMIWDALTGEGQIMVAAHKGSVGSLALSPDGRRVVSTGGWESALKIWDTTTGKPLGQIESDNSVYSVAFSPNGTRILAASRDKTVRVWDAASGRNLLTIRGREAYRVGRRYLLFLRRLKRPYFATTNWQHGSLRIMDDRVDDPRWPPDRSSWTYWSNARDESSDPKFPSTFKGSVPLGDATAAIKKAIQVEESEIDVGRIEIDGTFAHVVFEPGTKEHRVSVRAPRYASCPPLQVERLAAQLVTPDQRIVGSRASEPGSVPVSVDPLGVTTQVEFMLPPKVTADEVIAVAVTLDGEEGVFCLPHRRSSDVCPTESSKTPTVVGWSSAMELGTFFFPTPCRACGSSEVQRIAYGLYLRPNDPCKRNNLSTVRLGGCLVRNENWHCNMCGKEW